MKKTLLRVVCAIVVVMMALSVVVNAETKIGFSADYIGEDGVRVVDGKLHVDPGYKDPDFVDAEGGALINNGASAEHCIWALPKEEIANTKYLHFVINNDTANTVWRIGAYHGFGWDAAKVQIFAGLQKPADADISAYTTVTETTNGTEYVVDLSKLSAWDDEGASWTYFNIALDAGTAVNFDIYLTSGPDEPAVQTADMIGIFATIAAAAAAVVVFTKKH